MREFAFGDIEAALARMNDIADRKRVAFAGRLRVLQKNGVPMRDTPGRGRAGTFSLDHALQLAFSVELLQCGISPQRVGELIRLHWWARRDEILVVLLKLAELGETLIEDPRALNFQSSVTIPWVWAVQPNDLADLATIPARAHVDQIFAISTHGLSQFASQKLLAESGPTRMIIINVARLIQQTCHHLGARFYAPDFKALIDEYADLESGLRDAAQRFLDSFGKGPQTSLGIEGKREAMKDLETRLAQVDVATMPTIDMYPIARLLPHALPEEGYLELWDAATDLRLEGRIAVRGATATERTEGQAHLARLGIFAPVAEGEQPTRTGFQVTPFGRTFLNRFSEVWGYGNVDQKA